MLRAMSSRPLPDLFRAAVPVCAPTPALPPRSEEARLLETLLAPVCGAARAPAVAARLLAAFGGLAGVVAAPEARLQTVAGWDRRAAAQIKAVEAVALRLARAPLLDRPVLSCWDALLAYLRASLAHGGTERMRVLFLDRRNALIADEEVAVGTVDHVPVYPREVVRRALELDASALILAHNHPSGDPAPSESDRAMTEAVRDAAAVLGLALHDHVIVGRGREVSFRALGLL